MKTKKAIDFSMAFFYGFWCLVSGVWCLGFGIWNFHSLATFNF